MKNWFQSLLSNSTCTDRYTQACEQTKTLTHVLWSLLNSIPAQSVQRAHRHNSVALDLAVSASPNVYTLMGKEIDSEGGAGTSHHVIIVRQNTVQLMTAGMVPM